MILPLASLRRARKAAAASRTQAAAPATDAGSRLRLDAAQRLREADRARAATSVPPPFLTH